MTTSTNVSRSYNEGTHRVNRREKKEESNVNFRATKISIDVCSPVCRLRHLYLNIDEKKEARERANERSLVKERTRERESEKGTERLLES